MHLLHSNDPSLDKVAEADGQGHAPAARVKLLAVNRAARVMGSDDAARRRLRPIGTPLGKYLIIYTLRKRTDVRFLCFLGQPFLVGLCVLAFVHSECDELVNFWSSSRIRWRMAAMG